MNQNAIAKKIDFFQQKGYVIFGQAVSHEIIDQFAQDFNNLLQDNKPLKVNLLGEITSFQELKTTEEKEKYIRYGRFIDIEAFSRLGKDLILYPVISKFLTNLYQGNKPTNLQSLTYKYSSQQGEHSDRYLVSPDWAGDYQRDSLVAAWIALEDAEENNGALVIYPGSHLIPNKKKLKEDFNNNYQEYVTYCQQICQQNQIEPQYFYAQKGDILFWHNDFIHAGGVVKDWSKTRFSIVCHYANIGEQDFPLSYTNFRYYRQRVPYQNLGYFYQDLPKIHLQRDLLRLWDKFLIKQHRARVKIALARHKTKKIIKKMIGYQSKNKDS